jgi:hypothetical protein
VRKIPEIAEAQKSGAKFPPQTGHGQVMARRTGFATMNELKIILCARF